MIVRLDVSQVRHAPGPARIQLDAVGGRLRELEVRPGPGSRLVRAIGQVDLLGFSEGVAIRDQPRASNDPGLGLANITVERHAPSPQPGLASRSFPLAG